MLREAIGIGETEELAKANALNQLGLTSADGVEFEIIVKAEKKKFGLFGGKSAKVKAIYDEPEEDLLSLSSTPVKEEPKKELKEEPKEEPIVEQKEVEQPKAEDELLEDTVDEPCEATVSAEEVEIVDSNSDTVIENNYLPAKEARDYVEKVLNAMGIEGIEVTVTENGDSAEINLEGEQVGAVIGRRGETLDALQYLAGLVANHVGNSYYRITINTGNYREKREKTLEALGKKLAFKVLKTGRNVSLEPMNPYERRIIHTSVQKVNGAISWSEGEVTNRHVVIGLDPEHKRTYRKNYNNNRGGRRGYNGGYDKRKNYNRNNNYKKSENTAPKADREPINEGGNLSLYGKVDTKGE